MPIDFDNLDEFRRILNELHDKKGLTPNKLAAIWKKHKEGKGKDFPGVSANTLRKFKAGNDIANAEFLAMLWDFLEKNKTYGSAFSGPPP